MSAGTIRRTYTLQRDLDGDGRAETVTVTVDVPDLNGDGRASAEETRLALEAEAAVRRVDFTLTAEGQAVTLQLDGGLGAAELSAEDELGFDLPGLVAAVNAVERAAFGAELRADVRVPPIDQHTSTSDHPLSDCGPAALLSVLQAFGVPVTDAAGQALSGGEAIARLGELLGTNGTDGTGYPDIERVAAALGLSVSQVLGPDSEVPVDQAEDVSAAILAQLALGRPVMLSLSFTALMGAIAPGESGLATTHWVVISGYAEGKFIVTDPWTGQEYRIERARFEEIIEATAGIKGWSQIALLAFGPGA